MKARNENLLEKSNEFTKKKRKMKENREVLPAGQECRVNRDFGL